MNKAKQFIIEHSEQFSTAVDNGYDIRMTEAEILEWMQKYADSEVKKLNIPAVIKSKAAVCPKCGNTNDCWYLDDGRIISCNSCCWIG